MFIPGPPRMIEPPRGVGRLARGIQRAPHWRTPLLLRSGGVAASDRVAPPLGARLGRTRRASLEAVVTPAPPDVVAGASRSCNGRPQGRCWHPPVELGTKSVSVRLALADADDSSIELPQSGAAGAALVWDAPTSCAPVLSASWRG